MTSPQAQNYHPLTHKSISLWPAPPFTAGCQPHRGCWFRSAQGITVVWSQSSLCLAPLTWHRCSLLLLYPWCCQQGLSVFLAMHFAFCCLWGINPFAPCCCVLGDTPHRLGGNCILTLWGRKGIEEQEHMKAGIGCKVTGLCSATGTSLCTRSSWLLFLH